MYNEDREREDVRMKELRTAAEDFVAAEKMYLEAKAKVLKCFNYLPQYGGVLKIDWSIIRNIGRGSYSIHTDLSVKSQLRQVND